MPANITAEYTHPNTGEIAQTNIRLDVNKRRADYNPDGSDNVSLGESYFLIVTGPSGTTSYTRHIDGHVLDGLLGIKDNATTNVDADNGGTPADQLDMDGVCGIIAQLERPSIPTNVTAVYTADVTADSVINADAGNAGDEGDGAVSGTFDGTSDADWDVVVTTAGAFDGVNGKITVYEAGTLDVVKAEWAPTSASPDLIANGVSLTLTDGGDSSLIANDKWLIENTAAVAEGVLLTWTDSPDIVATYYKVVALTGTDWGTETVVDECDTGGTGTLVVKGTQLLNITSLNATPDDYKFAVYATMAVADTDLEGTYNQSLRSTPSNTVTVV